MNAQHLSIDELADAAEGLLDPEHATVAESHIARCPECRAQSDALREVSATLGTEPSAPMPEAVAHRLNEVIAAESARRSDAWKPRPTLGTFGQDLRKPSKSHWALPALAAAALAAVVGFGAYLISATAGLNEPPGSPLSTATTWGRRRGPWNRKRMGLARIASPKPGTEPAR